MKPDIKRTDHLHIPNYLDESIETEFLNLEAA